MDPMLGMIFIVPWNWAPYGYLSCAGQTIAIQQYEALYSLIGTVYGGDGVTNFQLPNFTGRVPVGPDPTGAVLGQPLTLGHTMGNTSNTVNTTGMASVTLTTANLPAHTHAATFNGTGGSASASIAVPADPTGPANTNVPGKTAVLSVAKAGNTAVNIYNTAPNATTMTTLAPFTVLVPAGSGTVTNANTGGGVPVPISMPLSVNVPVVQPSIAMNWIIAMNGLYPDRP
jgi:microcystin-dependent protein